MGIPVPARLNREQINACERFSLAVWGVPMFDREPSHNGRHGHGCTFCAPILAAAEHAPARIRQPWDVAA